MVLVLLYFLMPAAMSPSEARATLTARIATPTPTPQNSKDTPGA